METPEKTLEWRHGRQFGVFIIKFEHISYTGVSIGDVEQINTGFGVSFDVYS